MAHQEVKGKWIFAADLITEQEMRANSQLKYHAKNIIIIFTKCVQTVLETSNVDSEFLTKLGESHFHYGVRKEHFHVSLKFHIFQVCIFFSLLNQKIIHFLFFFEFKAF